MTSILVSCVEACSNLRKGLFKAAELLYAVRDSGAWKEAGYESFTAFVEQECRMDRGQASKILTVYEHYVIQGGVEPTQLELMNPERLYLARKTGGTVDHQISKAKTLTVRELREEQKDEDGHECEPITICKHCGKRL